MTTISAERTYDHFGQVVDELAIVQDGAVNEMVLKHVVCVGRSHQRSDLTQCSLTRLSQHRHLHYFSKLTLLCTHHIYYTDSGHSNTLALQLFSPVRRFVTRFA